MGRNASAAGKTASAAEPMAAKAAPSKPAPVKAAPAKAVSAPPRAAAAAAGAGGAKSVMAAKPGPAAEVKKAKFAVAGDEAPEFEVEAAPPEWNAEAEPQFGKKK